MAKKPAAKSKAQKGLPNTNPSGLPYGTGSIQMRGTKWWMIFRDPEGRVIQESSYTDDQDTARRMLACRAIVTLEARLAMLREVAHGGSKGGRKTGSTTVQKKAGGHSKNPGGSRAASGTEETI